MTAVTKAFPGIHVETEWVTTHGDRSESSDFRSQPALGVFEREVDERILSGEADLAVHSLKDLPPKLPEGLTILAVLPRGPSGDVIVSRGPALALDRLPDGARIGTSSPRRQAMIRYHNPSLEVVPLRGNVGTRLEKMEGGECDALVVAQAGIQRLGLTVNPYPLSIENFPPAPGQGIIAIVGRTDDLSNFADVRSAGRSAWNAMKAEREFLAAVGGGCSKALGGQFILERELFVAATWKEDGSARKMVRILQGARTPEELGKAVAQALEQESWRPRP